jgi:hypothetical protein
MAFVRSAKTLWKFAVPIAGALVCFLLARGTMNYCDLRLRQTYHPAAGVTCPVPKYWTPQAMTAFSDKGASAERSAPQELLAARAKVAASPPLAATYVSIRSEGGFGRDDTTLSATKDSAGRWRVTLRRRSPSESRDLNFNLTSDQIADLEKRLQSPCLTAEPAAVWAGALGGTCWDGPITVTDFAIEGRRRTVAQECLRIGSAADLDGFLFSLLPPLPASPSRITIHEKRTGFCPVVRRWAGPFVL